MSRINVLMVGSDLSVKGGMVSVIKNALSYKDWKKTKIYFEPSYIETGSVKKALFFLRSVFRIGKRIRKDQIQIVHLHVSERGSFYRKALILKYAHLKKCKVVLHHHGAEFFEFYEKGPAWQKKWIRRIVEEADLNLVLSRRLVGELKKVTPKAKVEPLYNAVPCSGENRYQNRGNLLMLGRLEERKGTYDLLEVLKELDDVLDPDLKINLCGDGDLERLKKWIDKLDIGHRIAHMGWIGKEEKEKIFRETMIHILFSYNEGLPMAILETMAYGIPNISTRVASIPEVIVPKKTGLLVEAGDKKALKEAVLAMCSDSELRERISKNSLKTIQQKFSLDEHIRSLENAYEAVVKGRFHTVS